MSEEITAQDLIDRAVTRYGLAVCGTCPFWLFNEYVCHDTYYPEDQIIRLHGYCRWGPPFSTIPNPTEEDPENVRWMHPITQADDSCARHPDWEPDATFLADRLEHINKVLQENIEDEGDFEPCPGCPDLGNIAEIQPSPDDRPPV